MSASRPAAVIILAAGEGTRMKSVLPKVLHPLCGRSMLGHAIAAARDLEPERLVVVVGHARDQVSAHVLSEAPDAQVVVQDHQNGTGHAVRTVIETVGLIPGRVLVTYGDMPLLRGETLDALAREHDQARNAVTVLTARVPDPAGYGRIVRDASGTIAEIVEDADATPDQRLIDEINSGCYAFDGTLLADAIKRVPSANAQGQEYLTDVVGILRGDGHRVGTLIADDAQEIEGVNDRVQLAQARRVYNDRLLEHWMRAGVTIVDPATTWLDAGVTLAPDVEIGPSTQLEGRTTIGAGAQVGPGVVLRDTVVGAGASVINAVCEQSEIGPEATVGPYTRLRPGSRLGRGARAGSFVEMKNANVGEGTKVPHLTYVGDADIGAGSNIGAATVFVNYDGVAKHRTHVGDQVRIGSDTMLVAPVQVGDGAYTAAGSVITEDVPAGALGIGRASQRNIPGWVARRRPGTASSAAAEAAQSEAAQSEVAQPEAARPADDATDQEGSAE
ncbi:MAG TPA: bifunctional UDP-N-acetylglucosamine diphosphorylase/glucosamine-1-phosphate N-acetyltransferase GlmU [Streptosporangiaceae bacterium]|nr:bifunctional UDP-N-acetylglucosamine diphosphorylase/glucosamine-1-phosphate N-acetyltransferase GlmU [Streptosporangiaceae bacterium]